MIITYSDILDKFNDKDEFIENERRKTFGL